MTNEEKIIMHIADTMIGLELGIIEVLKDTGEIANDKEVTPSEEGIKDRILAVIKEAKESYNIDVPFDEAYKIVKFAVEKAYGRIKDSNS